MHMTISICIIGIDNPAYTVSAEIVVAILLQVTHNS